MKKISTACFTGHRPGQLPFPTYPGSDGNRKMADFLDYYILYLHKAHGVTDFISGMALGVDMLAAERVLRLRESGIPIRLVCAIPCNGQSSRWRQEDRDRYNSICAAANEIIKLGHEYTDDCMQIRNKFMINNSSHCIAVWNGEIGGTSSTVRLARKHKLHLYIIDPNDFSVKTEDGDPEIGFFDM